MRHLQDADPTQIGIDSRVVPLAASQHGVFAQRQAEELGATRSVIRHRLQRGRWERTSYGVLRLAGSPSSWMQELMIACLAWGVGAAVSHRAAAAIWRLAGFEPGPLELTVPRNRRRPGAGVIHRHPLSRWDVTILDGVPVTTPARTLIDLVAVAPSESVEEALDDALRRGIVTIASVRRRLIAISRPGRTGIAAMRRPLDARDPSAAAPESVFERRLLRVLRDAGLPMPVLQYEIRDGVRRVAVVDFAYPDARLAIEADGYRWHSSRARWDHDRTRGNRLVLLGWRVIHVTWTDLKRPAALIALIRNAVGT